MTATGTLEKSLFLKWEASEPVCTRREKNQGKGWRGERGDKQCFQIPKERAGDEIQTGAEISCWRQERDFFLETEKQRQE